MILSKYNLRNIESAAVVVPDEKFFDLPEKVLQFGTGILLRGLPDYFIDKANRQGIFNGRIVVVKSTANGDSSGFDKQDGLFTQCIRGIENGEKKEENIINCSISRVLSATNEWEQILDCAHNMNMRVIISNTTEVGIQLVHEDIRRHPPVSFPGKLLAFLYNRFQAFAGSHESGMVIIPTELIPDNGKKLEAIVLELAHLNGLEDSFIEWLESSNYFCSSLVDRIVPGRPDREQQIKIEEELGYKDSLMIISEVYRLWAIEGNEEVKKVLSFVQADEGVIIEEDIELYRELKIRLLNGTHTLASGLSFLSGCSTVYDAMEDDTISSYISELMQSEIAPSIPYSVDPAVAQEFCNRVLDRFRNPEIQHYWLTITSGYSLKVNTRIIPVIAKHYELNQHAPELIALGFAAYLYFMKVVKFTDGKYYGEFEGKDYLVNDDQAGIFMKRWAGLKPSFVVQDTFRNNNWDEDLRSFPNFQSAVLEKLTMMTERGVRETISFVQSKKVFA